VEDVEFHSIGDHLRDRIAKGLNRPMHIGFQNQVQTLDLPCLQSVAKFFQGKDPSSDRFGLSLPLLIG